MRNLREKGRFPANFIHDGSQEVLDLFPDTKTGDCKTNKMGGVFGNGKTITNPTKGDSGSAARYFYCAKASKRDRDEGLEDMELRYELIDNVSTDIQKEIETHLQSV